MKSQPVTAMILAGGLGTRLRGIVEDLPKPMARVAEKPFLEWLIRQVRSHEIRSAVLCTGYLGNIVEEYFGDGSKWGLSLSYSRETLPMGTAGALRLAIEKTRARTLLVLNGDSYCRYDLKRLLTAHESQKAAATLWLVPVAERLRYGTVATNPDGSVSSFVEKDVKAEGEYINAGVYLLNRDLIASIPQNIKLSLETEVLPSLVGRGLYAVRGEGPFIDIGTPESFAIASSFMKNEQPKLGHIGIVSQLLYGRVCNR